MPQKEPSPEATADKLLREWAAKVAGATGKDVGTVLREAGILTVGRRKNINEKEVTFSWFTRHREGREEQKD